MLCTSKFRFAGLYFHSVLDLFVVGLLYTITSPPSHCFPDLACVGPGADTTACRRSEGETGTELRPGFSMFCVGHPTATAGERSGAAQGNNCEGKQTSGRTMNCVRNDSPGAAAAELPRADKESGGLRAETIDVNCLLEI